jgi:hypothetical protein
MILNKDRMKQIVDFSNLKVGGYTPTDIDFVMEKNNKWWVFGEVKVKGTPITKGQDILYQRLCDNYLKLRIPCMYILTHHNIPVNEIIDVGNLPVDIAEIVAPNKSGIWQKKRFIGSHEFFRGKTISTVVNKFALRFGV